MTCHCSSVFSTRSRGEGGEGGGLGCRHEKKKDRPRHRYTCSDVYMYAAEGRLYVLLAIRSSDTIEHSSQVSITTLYQNADCSVPRFVNTAFCIPNRVVDIARGVYASHLYVVVQHTYMYMHMQVGACKSALPTFHSGTCVFFCILNFFLVVPSQVPGTPKHVYV